ncbi:MAG: hypothetical protein V1907_04320 [Candidatus Kerfeldbacteria bacterium]
MNKERYRGNSLAFVLIFTSVVLIITIAIFDYTQTNTSASGKRTSEQNTIQIAEAGIEKAVWCLNNPMNTSDCQGNPSNYSGETDTSFGQGKFSVSWDSINRIITATGTTTFRGQSLSKQIQVRLSTNSEHASFVYGVQSGTGGIVFNNGAKILGAGGTPGNVYVAGPISIATGSGSGTEISGDAILSISDSVIEAETDPAASYTTFDVRGSTSTRYVVQSFKPTTVDKVTKVSLKMARTSSAPANPTLSIYYDNGSGIPGMMVSGAQIPINASSLPLITDPGWQDAYKDFAFTPQTLLSSGVRYWLVLQVSGANGSNYFSMVRSTTDTAYANNTAMTGNPLASVAELCSSPACDVAFQVWMGGVQPTLEIETIGGDARAYTMTKASIGKKAYYRNVTSGNVNANGGTEQCDNGDNTLYCIDIDMVPGSTDPEPVVFPISDQQIAVWEQAAEDAGEPIPCGGSPDPCNITGGSIGSRKYIGDVTISNTVTLAGAVWVKGNITLINGANLALSDAYGSKSGVIIADNPEDESTKVTSGRIIAQNDSMFLHNSTAGTFIMGIAMSASLDPTVAAFDIGNNFSKPSINPNAAAVVYAPKGVAKVSQNGEMKEVTAQKLYLENNAIITYESGLSSVWFSSGPGASWAYQEGTYQIL